MTWEPDATQLVTMWLDKARAALDSAQAEHAADRLDFAVNRAYYAAFYAASAALLALGQQFTRHAGLRAAVHRELVKRGRLDAQWGQAFDRLFESRQRADYLAFAGFENGEVAKLIEDATGFHRGNAHGYPIGRTKMTTAAIYSPSGQT